MQPATMPLEAEVKCRIVAGLDWSRYGRVEWPPRQVSFSLACDACFASFGALP
jgi:hypothetical protein